MRGVGNRQLGIHPILLIATFLDPRFKGLFVIPDEESRVAIKEAVLGLMVDNANEHSTQAAGAPAPAAGEAKQEEDDDDDGANVFARMMQQQQQQQAAAQQHQGGSSIEDKCKQELKDYETMKHLDLGTMVGKEFKHNDPLKWWKEQQRRFPTLARLAKIYLAVMATSAPSERIFSVASRIISARRTNLDPETAGKLLFVAKNWNWFEGKVNMDALVANEEEEVVVV